MRAISFVLCVACVACGGHVGGEPDATTKDSGDEEDAAVDVVADATVDHGFLQIVDGGGDEPWCHQDPFDKAVFQSCCDSNYCKGFCIADDGGVSCSCFGVPGGCNGLKAAPGFRVVCINGGCGIENCPPQQICGPSCCDPDQYCDADAGDGGGCVPR